MANSPQKAIGHVFSRSVSIVKMQAFLSSRRVIDDVSHPSLSGERETQDGWGAAGIISHEIFAACLSWVPKTSFQ